MAIVKGLVEQMHGTVRVESEEGIGSSFEVTLPFDAAQDPGESGGISSSDRPDIHGVSILLVEDNELNAEIAKALLTDAVATVTEARNGKLGVELFEMSPVGAFDIVLMDIMMPVMDGLSAAKAIRASSHPDAETIPIVAMTANAFVEDAEKCFAAGMNGHLAKPLDLQKILSAISENVRKNREKQKTGTLGAPVFHIVCKLFLSRKRHFRIIVLDRRQKDGYKVMNRKAKA